MAPGQSEPDMNRDAVPDKSSEFPMPQLYGYPDTGDEPLPFCWHCRCYYLWCGGCCEESRLPLKLRVRDFMSGMLFKKAGMYEGGHFDREKVEQFTARGAVPAGEDKEAGVLSWDTHVPSSTDPNFKIRVRIFNSTTTPNEKKKVMVYFHGGGWCLAHPDTQGLHRLGTRYAQAGYIVVSVDYRLAPENPFPAGLCDCFDVCQWVASRPASEPCFTDVDVSKLDIGGDSAGGNFAMVISTLVRDGLDANLKPCNIPFSIRQQILSYPSFQMRRFVKETPSPHLPFLTRAAGDFFFNSYVPGATVADKRKLLETERRLCPLLAGFHNLPRTVMISAGADFLRFENKISADIMKQVGTEVVYHVFPSMPHGFLTLMHYPPAEEGIAWIVKELQAGSK